MTHPEPEVRTAAGAVRGRSEGGVAVFRGIPFAEPPVGALRFAAPSPVRRWDGVRTAVAFGPPTTDTADGDWLTVNVWSPAPDPAARLPVMVWIHGGAYTIGWSGLPEYDGGRLARDGEVVLVTFNYRVGIDGFAHLDGAPANRGLLDQVAALEWVRDNIAGFGGNPGRVTVFGESAGGGSVAALLAMPRAAGLFHRAVAQSAQGTFFTPELAAAIAAASFTSRWGRAGHRGIVFSPVVDGDVLPVTPWQALAAGAGREIDLLAGHTRDEQRLFSALDGQLGEVTAEQAEAALHALGPGPDGVGRYREAFPGADPEELFELVNSDWLFRMPTIRLAEEQAAAGGRAHVYELTWPAPGMGGILGACHGLDVPLVFGNLRDGEPAMLLGDDLAEAEPLSARMRAAWTAFAAAGDPDWPAYEPGSRLVQLFDARPVVVADPERTSRLLWQDHPFAPLSLTG